MILHWTLSLRFLIPHEVSMFPNLYKLFEVKDGSCPFTQHFGPKRCIAPSTHSANTWGTEFKALVWFVPKSSVSLPLLFNCSWKPARSSWLLPESLASLPHIFQAYFFHWPDVLMYPVHIPHLSFLSALSQSKMWNDPCFHWHSSVLGFFPPN